MRQNIKNSVRLFPVLAALLVHSSPGATSIAVDFVGATGNCGVLMKAPGTQPMGPDEETGVVAQKFWNRADGANGTVNNLKDNTGKETQVSISYTSPCASTYCIESPDSPGIVRMFRGFLDPHVGDEGTCESTVKFSNLGTEFTADGYKVIAYVENHSEPWCSHQVGEYAVGDETKYDVNGWEHVVDHFVESGDKTTHGNYLVFDNLSGSEVTMTWKAIDATGCGVMRAPLNGIQVVANDDVPAVDRGSAGATALSGGWVSYDRRSGAMQVNNLGIAMVTSVALVDSRGRVVVQWKNRIAPRESMQVHLPGSARLADGLYHLILCGDRIIDTKPLVVLK
jgi:hypothetical protein